MRAVPASHDSPSSGTSTSRPLTVRKRPDIVAVRQHSAGEDYYVLKNPVDLQYFRLLDEEFFIWRSLEVDTSLDQLKRDFERRFPPQRVGASDLQRLIVSFHERNLIYSAARGQGEQLIRRRSERRRREWLQKLSNPLAMRFRGVDPNDLLEKLRGFAAIVFHPMFVGVWIIVLTLSAGLALLRFADIAARLPTIEAFLTPTHLFWLAAVTAVVKVFHELGHGLACKHFGGEVRELGFMFLMFAPCLYCNASDAWMFPSRRRRAAVGAAGLYFESMLACAALWIWWLASPGALRDVALDVAFVCSISTLVFNGNPLLRFDGYYILADLLGIPNFSEKCALYWKRTLASLCLGIEYPPDFQLPANRNGLLAVYGIAAFAYRWFVTLSIMYFLYTYFKQHQLTPLFYLVVLLGFAPRSVRTLWKLGKMLSNPGLLPRFKAGRCAATAAIALVTVAGILAVPIPHSVMCPAEIVPAGDVPVYVEMSGVLTDTFHRFGDPINAGEVVAVLENVDAELETRRLRAQCDEYAAQLAALERNQFNDPAAALEIALTREGLEASQKLLEQREADVRRLRVIAGASGRLLPPPELVVDRDSDEGLPRWSGDVFEPRNRRCLIEEGTMICRIGDPQRLEAELVVEHRDWELVAIGQRVEIMVDAAPGRTLTGTIVELGEANLRTTPKRLSNAGGGELSSKTDADGVERPRHASYFARVALDPGGVDLLRLGVRGRAKVRVGSATAYEIADRYLRNLFTFRL